MRQNSGKKLFYVIAGLLAAVLLWTISREIPFTPETVEQPLENTFAD